MPKYVILLNWTEQGVQSVGDSIERYRAAEQELAKRGGSFETVLWTTGPHDLVSIVEAPDDETLAAFLLKLAGAGNLRSQTMRAFTASEMSGILDAIG